MAENKYSVRIRQAFAGLNVLKPAIQKLARDGKTNTPEYRALLKQLQDAQANYDKLKRAEKRFLEEQKATKKAKGAEPLQGDLDVALATGDKAKADEIAQDMIDAGVQPKDANGKPLPGFTLEDKTKDGAKGYLGSGTKDKPLTLDGENYTGTYKNKKYENGILVTETPKPDKKPSGVKGDQTPPAGGGGQDIKDLWTSYLRSTFATLEDKTQKAEIDGLLARAKSEKWDEDTFMDALEGTVWWQTTLPSMRQFFLDTHDKRNASTFAEKMRNTMDSTLGKLETLGIQVRQIDPTTGKVTDNSEYLKGIAMKAIENGWDDDQLENYLSTQGNIIFSGGGTLGSYYDRVAQQAFLYGVPLDATMKQTINTSLLDPMDGRDVNYWIKSVKDMAYDAPQNKPFLPALQQGRNLYEVTNSYRQQMASLLEVDSTAITWNDLMGKVIDGNSGNARTFADFTKQLKQDPLWQVTRNAKETYSNTALDIAKMFGFMG